MFWLKELLDLVWCLCTLKGNPNMVDGVDPVVFRNMNQWLVEGLLCQVVVPFLCDTLVFVFQLIQFFGY